ncbi:hypothetical protein OG2516_04194 [Oceanicola granulosus HTCC2516]|uniref:Uncharacterized protein n=1 Tax=Oceanicola granulosus (strain ATCC BAA-861 / DSM 15982 / KCTC 12143 / HTCC2516) TaxID=314256 RepID=Q2CED0_OCEGH|nr:hypothetical protein [Oceanicola granulosus]EAR51067.1 hypothetical protein OG2516_04194 [Oceanicola granulosus HTCC2516]
MAKSTYTPNRFEVAFSRTHEAATAIIREDSEARDRKIARLREARLEKEAAERAAAAPPAKPKRRATAKAR